MMNCELRDGIVSLSYFFDNMIFNVVFRFDGVDGYASMMQTPPDKEAVSDDDDDPFKFRSRRRIPTPVVKVKVEKLTTDTIPDNLMETEQAEVVSVEGRVKVEQTSVQVTFVERCCLGFRWPNSWSFPLHIYLFSKQS